MNNETQRRQQELRNNLNSLPTVVKFRMEYADPNCRFSDSTKTLFNTREEAEAAAKDFEPFGGPVVIKEEVRRAR
jgi:hypothetical protein